MSKNEIKKIISEYKPHKGFYDLSNKPERLSDEEYAKIIKAQNLLASQNNKDNIEYLKKFNKKTWQINSSGSYRYYESNM